MRGSMARDKKALRNLDDEIYRIAPKTYASVAFSLNLVILVAPSSCDQRSNPKGAKC